MFNFFKRKIVIGVTNKYSEKQLREIFSSPEHPLLKGVNALIDEEVAERMNIGMDVTEKREARDGALGGVEGLMSLRARIEDLSIAASEFTDAKSVEPAPGVSPVE